MSWTASGYVKGLRSRFDAKTNPRGLTRSEKFMLLTLADYHNDETGRCDTSVKRLAEDCLMTRRAAQLTLHSLQDKEWIRIEERTDLLGRTRTNQYWIAGLYHSQEGVVVTPSKPDGEGVVEIAPGRSSDHGEGVDGFAQTVSEPSKGPSVAPETMQPSVEETYPASYLVPSVTRPREKTSRGYSNGRLKVIGSELEVAERKRKEESRKLAGMEFGEDEDAYREQAAIVRKAWAEYDALRFKPP